MINRRFFNPDKGLEVTFSQDWNRNPQGRNPFGECTGARGTDQFSG